MTQTGFIAELLKKGDFMYEIARALKHQQLHSNRFTTQFSYKDIGTFLIVLERAYLLLKAPSTPHPIKDVYQFCCDSVFVLS